MLVSKRGDAIALARACHVNKSASMMSVFNELIDHVVRTKCALIGINMIKYNRNNFFINHS